MPRIHATYLDCHAVHTTFSVPISGVKSNAASRPHFRCNNSKALAVNTAREVSARETFFHSARIETKRRCRHRTRLRDQEHTLFDETPRATRNPTSRNLFAIEFSEDHHPSQARSNVCYHVRNSHCLRREMQKVCSLTHITHPKYSSSKGFNEDRPLDEAAATARNGAALAAANTEPDATRSMVLHFLRTYELLHCSCPLFRCLCRFFAVTVVIPLSPDSVRRLLHRVELPFAKLGRNSSGQSRHEIAKVQRKPE